MNNKKITSIVYVRVLATIMIFTCHLFFISGAFEISMWFNTGVPLFFIISAYLMFNKKFDGEGVLTFYKKRVISIFVPYEIYLLAIILALCVIHQPPSLKAVLMYGLGLAGFSNVSILGLGHFWYITVLLFCYFITPLVLGIFCQWNDVIKKRIALFLVIIGQFLFLGFMGYPSYGIHIGGYIFTLCYFVKRSYRTTNREMQIWIVLAVIISMIRLVLDPIFRELEYAIYYTYDALFQPVARFILAMAIFVVFIENKELMYEWSLKHKRINHVIQAISGISYEIYLTHQFIQLSLWKFIPFFHKGIGILGWSVVCIIFTGINALFLYEIKKYIYKHINCS